MRLIKSGKVQREIRKTQTYDFKVYTCKTKIKVHHPAIANERCLDEMICKCE